MDLNESGVSEKCAKGVTALPLGHILSTHSAGAYDLRTSTDAGIGWTSVSTIVTAISSSAVFGSRCSIVVIPHFPQPATSARIAHSRCATLLFPSADC